jgi:hypothetical protein
VLGVSPDFTYRLADPVQLVSADLAEQLVSRCQLRTKLGGLDFIASLHGSIELV